MPRSWSAALGSIVAVLTLLVCSASARAEWTPTFNVPLDGNPSLTYDVLGNAWATTQAGNGGIRPRLLVRAPGENFQVVSLPTKPGVIYAIAAGFDATGTATIVWWQGNTLNTSPVYAVRRSPGINGTFSAVETVGSDRLGSLSVSPSGGALLTEAGDNGFGVRYSPPGATTAFDDTPDILDPAIDYVPYANAAVQLDADGKAIVTWSSPDAVLREATTNAAATGIYVKRDLPGNAYPTGAFNGAGDGQLVSKTETAITVRRRAPGGGYAAPTTIPGPAGLVIRELSHTVGPGGRTAILFSAGDGSNVGTCGEQQTLYLIRDGGAAVPVKTVRGTFEGFSAAISPTGKLIAGWGLDTANTTCGGGGHEAFVDVPGDVHRFDDAYQNFRFAPSWSVDGSEATAVLGTAGGKASIFFDGSVVAPTPTPAPTGPTPVPGPGDPGATPAAPTPAPRPTAVRPTNQLKDLRAKADSNTATLRISARFPWPGTFSVRATAQLKGKPVTVDEATLKVEYTGSESIVLRADGAALAFLKAKQKLPTTIAVSYTPIAGTKGDSSLTTQFQLKKNPLVLCDGPSYDKVKNGGGYRIDTQVEAVKSQACGAVKPVLTGWVGCAYGDDSDPGRCKKAVEGYGCTTKFLDELDEFFEETGESTTTGRVTCTNRKKQVIFYFEQPPSLFQGCDDPTDVAPATPGSVSELGVRKADCAEGAGVVRAFNVCRLEKGLAGRCVAKVAGYACREIRESLPGSFTASVVCASGKKSVRFAYSQATA